MAPQSCPPWGRAVLCGSSAIWLGRAENMAAVYAWAFLVGSSSAFIYVPALTVVQRWYPARRGLISGFFSDRLGRSRTMAVSFAGAAVS